MSPTNWRSPLFFILLQFMISSSNPHPQFPCSQPHQNSLYPFCNTSLSISTRSQSLISLLTLNEKIHQLSNTASWNTQTWNSTL
ncbi:hypothetical protein M0R45_004822 [Rubus argutus]|uniref:Uncharacterized protein n=1 Tax=Rubus argutus TaxID=59490 RepID=A0AAW1YKZ7_RUBAR